jgi:pimeloyl-ACP methyl ester carboxylesterase
MGAAHRYTYELMAQDVVFLMDFLKVRRAPLIGWSDGGIIGLVMATEHPTRLERVYAYGANSDPSRLCEGLDKNETFNKYIENMGNDYVRLSATPKDYNSFLEAIGAMWATEPNITGQLGQIKTPITIADGEFDEAIQRSHTEMMAKAIPNVKLEILPGVSHFGMWQNPTLFNDTLKRFLVGQ